MATLLHLYCPGLREADQAPTWDLLEMADWPPDLCIVHCPGPDPLDNARWLLRHWLAPGDLLTLEQDIMATPEHVAALRACEAPVCAWDFNLAHGVPWSEVPGGTGIGLWKATEARRRTVVPTPPVPQVPWHDLAAMLWDYVGPAHVHRPLIGHNHRA